MADDIAPDLFDLLKLNRWILGRYEPGFVITKGDLSPVESVNPYTCELTEFGGMEMLKNSLFSPGDLSQILLQLKIANQWPPIVLLDSSLPPVSRKGGRGHFLVISDVSPDGRLLSYDNTWGKSNDMNGAPSVDSLVVGKSIHSPLFSIFPFVAKNSQYFSDYASPAKWSERKEQLRKMSASLGAAGLDLSRKDHQLIHSDRDVKKWLGLHTWDKRLTAWKSTLDFLLMAKYPDKP